MMPFFLLENLAASKPESIRSSLSRASISPRRPCRNLPVPKAVLGGGLFSELKSIAAYAVEVPSCGFQELEEKSFRLKTVFRELVFTFLLRLLNGD